MQLCVRVLLVAATTVVGTAATSDDVLVITARGMACSNWTTRGQPAPILPTDCIHSAATKANPNGGVGVWMLDPKTGESSAVAGVTDVAKSMELLDVNFAGDVTYLMVDMYHHSFAAIDIDPASNLNPRNGSGGGGGSGAAAGGAAAAAAGSITLFNVSRPPGTSPGDTNNMPRWLGAASTDRMLGWSRYEVMGGPSIEITETLLAIDLASSGTGRNTSTILYQNQTTISYTDKVPSATFGTVRTLSTSSATGSSILHTYADSVLKDWSPSTGKLLQKAAVSLPAGYDLRCLFYNEAAGGLAGLAFPSLGAHAVAAAKDPYYVTLDCSSVHSPAGSSVAGSDRKCTATTSPLTGLAKKIAGLSWLPTTCSYSARTGTVAALLAKVDPIALPAFGIEEIALFALQTPSTTSTNAANFWVVRDLSFPFGDAGAGRSWRPVGFPFLSFNTGRTKKL